MMRVVIVVVDVRIVIQQNIVRWVIKLLRCNLMMMILLLMSAMQLWLLFHQH